jgi:Cu/Ag efflux protein CusF
LICASPAGVRLAFSLLTLEKEYEEGICIDCSRLHLGDFGHSVRGRRQSKMDMSGSSAKSAGEQASMAHGEIKKVDKATGKLTIKAGPIANLGMDAMTMVYNVKDPAMLSQVKVGDKIGFVAEEVNGVVTVTRLQKQ